jgi:single-strand DNA-binding protein
MYCKVTLVGRLGKDPEARYTQANQKVVSFTVATTERWKDKAGERQERTEWHSVVIFNEHLADIAERYLRKGRMVFLEGQLQTRKWTDQSGTERQKTEVVLPRFRGELVLLGGGGDDASGRNVAGSGADDYADEAPRGSGAGGRSAPTQRGGRGTARPADDLDDEIPF